LDFSGGKIELLLFFEEFEWDSSWLWVLLILMGMLVFLVAAFVWGISFESSSSSSEDIDMTELLAGLMLVVIALSEAAGSSSRFW
jgi:cell division septal protein FtsQ